MNLAKEMVQELVKWAKSFPFYGQEQFSRMKFLDLFEEYVESVEKRLSDLEKK